MTNDTSHSMNDDMAAAHMWGLKSVAIILSGKTKSKWIDCRPVRGTEAIIWILKNDLEEEGCHVIN